MFHNLHVYFNTRLSPFCNVDLSFDEAEKVTPVSKPPVIQVTKSGAATASREATTAAVTVAAVDTQKQVSPALITSIEPTSELANTNPTAVSPSDVATPAASDVSAVVALAHVATPVAPPSEKADGENSTTVLPADSPKVSKAAVPVLSLEPIINQQLATLPAVQAINSVAHTESLDAGLYELSGLSDHKVY